MVAKMKSTIIFNKHETDIFNDLKSGDTMMLMRPLKKQPPGEYEITVVKDNLAYFEPPNGEYRFWNNIPLQYPVGTYGVRETWSKRYWEDGILDTGECEYHFKCFLYILLASIILLLVFQIVSFCLHLDQ